MMIAITSGVQIFCWLATLWSGRLQLTTALHFVFGFIFIFVMGGMTGVMLASIPFDLQTHDTFFVVAHFHYVLIGGALFPLFGAFHYWFPKLTGRLMDERLGKLSFWILFIAFNMTFFPMHWLGMMGMTRRVYTYIPGLGWENANMAATIGAFVILVGGVVFITNALRSLAGGARAGNDPWDASTLEWEADSPPAPYNFPNLPVVTSPTRLWTPRAERSLVVGLREDRREVLITNVLDAEPHHRCVQPRPSLWPLLTALGFSIGLAGSIFAFSWYYVASVLGMIGLIGWFWPERPLKVDA
jgi:cytochrome c oxidase subunit 1